MTVLALDIGGTAIKSALFCGGEMAEFRECASDGKEGGEAVLRRALAVAQGYAGYSCIGVSTAGQVDPFAGVITYANQNIPGYTGMPLAERLLEKTGVPVYCENDVYCAAMGESAHGAARGQLNFLMLTYGTGIGGAVVQGGAIYRGAHGLAGELGHMVTHAKGRLCACGGQGCYEQYASTAALVRLAKEKNPALTSGRILFEAAQQGDKAAAEVLESWMDEVEAGLAALLHLFDPGCIVLGGGIMNEKPIVKRLQSHLPRRLMPPYRQIPLVGAELGNKAGLYGAAAMAANGGLK